MTLELRTIGEMPLERNKPPDRGRATSFIPSGSASAGGELRSFLLSSALAACTVGPDYSHPKPELVPFHNTADASSSRGHSGQAFFDR
jgi:hypothetical protein